MRFRVPLIWLVLAAGIATEPARATTTIRVLNICDPLAVAAFLGNNLGLLQSAIDVETYNLNLAMARSQLSVIAQNVGVVQAPDYAIDSTATRDVANNIWKRYSVQLLRDQHSADVVMVIMLAAIGNGG